MAYYGKGAFDNDKAFDWLEECSTRTIKRKIKIALNNIIKYNPKVVKPWSKERITNFINSMVEMFEELPQIPPKDSVDNHLSREDWLIKFRNDLSDEYESGRYLDEEYGPVEEALAAAELVALWSGAQPQPMEYDSEDKVKILFEYLKQKPCPKEMVVLATSAIESILSNKNYYNMRKWWLDPYDEIKVEFNHMESIELLLKRLRGQYP